MQVQRVERHIITKYNENFKAINEICFKSKNLYNYTNYILRQSFINTNKIPNEYELVKKFRARHNEVYYDLCGNINQQCIRSLYNNWKSFFKSIKDWSKNKTKYSGKPNLPKYKNKDGRSICILTYGDARIKGEYLHVNSKVNLKPVKTKVKNEDLQQVRFIPKSNCYIIEIVYNTEAVNIELNKTNYLSIDLGINNFATCYDNHDNKAFIINGKPIKSINQYYNKKKALLMSYIKDRGTSNRINQLNYKRANKINDFMHKASKSIIDYCTKHDIGTIIIGHNKDWKNKINLGKINNQKFIMIPYNEFIQKLQYKCENYNINLIITEESYTSKIDHLALEEMHKQENYLGKRIKRGLFRSSINKVINADLNGAVGILRKVIDESQFIEIVDRGFVINPVRINILTKNFIKLL